VDVQCFEEDPGEVDWSGREVGRLLTRHIDDPLIAESLARLRGTWPFNATSKCRSINTRDIGYRQIAAVQGSLTHAEISGKSFTS